MKKSIITIVLLFSVILAGISKGKVYTEERPISKFNKISVCCGIEVSITEGTSSTLKIEASHADLLDKITTNVKGDKLEIGINSNNSNSFSKFKVVVYVSASNLETINATSGSEVYCNGNLTADDIKLSVTSGAEINLHIKANNLTCDATSGGEIDLTGSASFAKVRAASGADIEMGKMTVAKANVQSTSGADVTINVTDEIIASANSSGDIVYKGSPKMVEVNSSSSGSVKKR